MQCRRHWSATRRDRETIALTAATTRFKAMSTYGQFAWYEPLRMTVILMKLDEAVVEDEDCWLVE